jgi:putative tricarboxylic transport membrane protein
VDLFANLALGFSVAFTPTNLMLCFVGVMIGTLIGVLPGLGPIATIAMLLPFTFKLDPTGALIMLAGIYYGAQYGGSTTAILLNIPGEATSVVTTLDGHQMAKRGMAGKALAIAAIGSFCAGSVATLIVAALGVPLTEVALLFSQADYFSLMVLGLVFAVVLARGSVLKALAMVMFGLLVGTIGSDIESGEQRLTFGILELADGVPFVVLAIGMIGFAEILRNLENPETRDVIKGHIGGLMPSREDLKTSAAPIARGTLIGSILGILPGNGAVMGPFASYALEKRMSRTPERFGTGAIEGVAGPEAANNAGAQTAFIPMLTLGIPPNAVMAVMIGAMTIHGIIPGPQVISREPGLFWGMIASMWLGNIMLVIINLPLIGLWVKLLRVPYRFLFPAILIFCCIGVYSIRNTPFDVALTAAFGLIGYFFAKKGFEAAPFLIAVVLGDLMEEKLRQAMLRARGDVSIFVTEPLSLVLLLIAAALLAFAILPAIRRRREEVFTE